VVAGDAYGILSDWREAGVRFKIGLLAISNREFGVIRAICLAERPG
jgi:hypothetical protein